MSMRDGMAGMGQRGGTQLHFLWHCLVFKYVTPQLIYLQLCFAGLLSCAVIGLYFDHVFGRLGEWAINCLP